jgi:polyhydroxyalkanoate synthesis regulator protein
MTPEAFAKVAETNMAMFKAAASVFMPESRAKPGAANRDDDELAALKKQMAEMQERLGRLGK